MGLGKELTVSEFTTGRCWFESKCAGQINDKIHLICVNLGLSFSGIYDSLVKPSKSSVGRLLVGNTLCDLFTRDVLL